MVKITQASTVQLWREMYLERPNLNFNDYRIEWADLQNLAEGTDQTAKSAGLVSKYLKIFKAEMGQAEVILEPGNSDPMAEMLTLKSELVGLAAEAEGVTTQCRYLAEVLGKTVDLLTDNHIIANLTAQTAKMQAEITRLKQNLEMSEAQAQQEREYRNRPTHGEATR